MHGLTDQCDYLPTAEEIRDQAAAIKARNLAAMVDRQPRHVQRRGDPVGAIREIAMPKFRKGRHS